MGERVARVESDLKAVARLGGFWVLAHDSELQTT